ncbi:CRISPR-associated endonuclease Cas2 [Candidatus Parcubacteria bacterium]|nr:CRISPR-associated endonuclease Cas2 [Candidatus Parcubacteria bacterium]
MKINGAKPVRRRPKLRGPSREFLRYLAVAGVVVAISLIAPQLPVQLLKNFLRRRHTFDPSSFRQFGARLHKQGLVKMQQRESILTFRLTAGGERLAQQIALTNISIVRPPRWDGLWRVVLFDIPEHDRFTRDSFRALLERIGFVKIQRSVFAHPFPCDKEIELAVRVFHLDRSVILFTATTLSDDRRLRSLFNL